VLQTYFIIAILFVKAYIVFSSNCQRTFIHHVVTAADVADKIFRLLAAFIPAS
jgi:hypothetical protein